MRAGKSGEEKQELFLKKNYCSLISLKIKIKFATSFTEGSNIQRSRKEEENRQEQERISSFDLHVRLAVRRQAEEKE